jgi:hypothetical protein
MVALDFIMDKKLRSLVAKLENQRKQIISEVSQLSADRYSQSPPGKWSIAIILTHIVISERLSLNYMKKKSLGIETAGEAGWIELIKSILLTISQNLPLRFKAPKAVLENTPPAFSIESLTNEWAASRIELITFLETIDARHTNKKIYKHPVVGKLNVFQALRFFSEHIIHHLPQIKRLL